MMDLAHPYANRSGTAQYVNLREVGFGTDPDTRARFALVRWEDFIEEVREESRIIVGSVGRMKTQNVTILPPQTPELEIVTSTPHYRRLKGMATSIQDLILPLGATVYDDEEYDVANPTEADEVYVVVHGVKLVTILAAQHFEEDRTRFRAVFRKVGV